AAPPSGTGPCCPSPPRALRCAAACAISPARTRSRARDAPGSRHRRLRSRRQDDPMRIYLPLLAQDRPVLRERRAFIDLEPGQAAGAGTSEESADRPGQDAEVREYEELQDAVHVAFTAAERSERVLVIAADAPDDVIDAATEEGGAFGIRMRQRRSARIASFHVAEQDAAEAEADDTDPALLWFDAGEGEDALAFLDIGATT